VKIRLPASRRLVTDYLEGALSPAERARLEAHLADCDYCLVYLAQIRATIDIAGQIEPEVIEPEVLDELVTPYRRWQSG